MAVMICFSKLAKCLLTFAIQSFSRSTSASSESSQMRSVRLKRRFCMSRLTWTHTHGVSVSQVGCLRNPVRSHLNLMRSFEMLKQIGTAHTVRDHKQHEQYMGNDAGEHLPRETDGSHTASAFRLCRLHHVRRQGLCPPARHGRAPFRLCVFPWPISWFAAHKL